MSHRVEAVGETTSLAERKRRAGQRLVVGLPGPHVDADTRALIRLVQPAGFILFKRNVEDPAQVRELNRELASLLPKERPAILTVDQEGGRVQRIRDGATRFPPMRHLGNCDDLELTRRLARALANEVLALGFHLSFAPVADVDSNPANPVIGDRSFGRDPRRVAQQVAAFVEAAQDAGMMCCAKHFPGHGDTSSDSHLELPVVEKEPPELERTELPPFAAAVRAGVASVMTAHVLYPAWDEKNPATMSPRILIPQLRERLGFQGVLFSDDLEMKAVRGRFPLFQQLKQASLATVDLFLACESQALQVEAYETLVRQQEEEPALHRAAEESERRLLALRERFLLDAGPRPDLSVLGQGESLELAMLVKARGGEA